MEKKPEETRCGILCIDKPAGFTSFDVIAKARGILRQRKIGHAGTLDPMATGVLPLFLGRATKCCDILPIERKRYSAVLQLGVTTDTQDLTGTILSRRPVTVGQRELEAVLPQFTGCISQLPPMYSAVHVGGQRLYDLARQGIEVEREERQIYIESLQLVSTGEAHTYTLDVLCSKGTYVRTLIHDIGQALGCGAAMAALRRTMSSGWTLEDCITIEQLQELARLDRVDEAVLPLESAFAALPRVQLTEKQAHLYRNGVVLSLRRLPQLAQKEAGEHAADLAIYCGERFLGVSYANFETDSLCTKKLFAISAE